MWSDILANNIWAFSLLCSWVVPNVLVVVFYSNSPPSCFVISRYHYPVPKIFYVQLSVGSYEFIGEGRTRQAARHSAAMKALQALRNEPIPERPTQVNT